VSPSFQVTPAFSFFLCYVRRHRAGQAEQREAQCAPDGHVEQGVLVRLLECVYSDVLLPINTRKSTK
jgi:hypothetical protein